MLPPVEVIEPEPLTAVTVPAAVVVAIIFPFWSTAKTEEVKPFPKVSWLMVVVANVEVPVTLNSPEAERLVVEALLKVVWPVTARVPPIVRRLEMVVEPVMARVLEVGLK